MANKKRIITTVGAMAITAVLAVGGTLAYLSTITNTETNKFSSSKNITGELTEDEWKYGEEGWTDYIPGESTSKNPKIELTDTNVYAAVGMRLICKDTDGNTISFSDFQSKYAAVSTNGTAGIGANWTKMSTTDGSDFFYYNTTLKEASTDPLFTDVTVNTGIKSVYYAETEQQTIRVYKTDAEGNKTALLEEKTGETITVSSGEKVYIVVNGEEVEVDGADVKLPKFDIILTGYAVQAQNQNAAAAPSTTDLASLKALAGIA